MAARKLYNLMEIVMIQGPLGKEGVLENTSLGLHTPPVDDISNTVITNGFS